MTVPYTQSVSTARIGGFFRLLFRWRGSIYQVIYGEFIIFIIVYYALNLSYRVFMRGTQWEPGFRTFSRYCEGFADFIPVTFVLGFYVVHACARRWTQWENLPWPDKIAFDISGHMIGADAKKRMLRRTLIRYVNLASVLCFRDISLAVRKRLPTLKHVVEAGLMNEAELTQFQKTAATKDSNWWIPFHWAYNLIYRAKIEGAIPEGSANKLQDAIMDLRQKCWVLFGHDWIPIPMVYTQVATLAVYLFMLASLFGRQQYKKKQLGGDDKEVDMYVPVFPFLQVIFYLGWLKVGEVLTNPFGGDADDFEMNYIVDRNLRISYAIVDENYNTVPPIEKDAFWNTSDPSVPYTTESEGLRTDGYIGSAVPSDQQESPAAADGAVADGAAGLHRSNSIRSTVRTRKLSKPIGRLLSRVSDRNSNLDMKVLNAAEKGEGATPTETPQPSPTLLRRKDGNLRSSNPSRLPSIVEGSENLLQLTPEDGLTYAGSMPITPQSDNRPPLICTAVLEEDDGDRSETIPDSRKGKDLEERTPLLAWKSEPIAVGTHGTAVADPQKQKKLEREDSARRRAISLSDNLENSTVERYASNMHL